MMLQMEWWGKLGGVVGLRPPPNEWVGNDGKGIYFDSIDNSAYILGQAQHSARNGWIYIDGENFNGARADIGGGPKEPLVQKERKYPFIATTPLVAVTPPPSPIQSRCTLPPHPPQH